MFREVRRLLREGANANLQLRRKGGLSPFHLSVGLTGHKALEIVAVLLDGNAHPNNRSHDGLTPLHIAGQSTNMLGVVGWGMLLTGQKFHVSKIKAKLLKFYQVHLTIN